MAEEGYTFKPYYVAHTKINTLALLDERQGAKWKPFDSLSLRPRSLRAPFFG